MQVILDLSTKSFKSYFLMTWVLFQVSIIIKLNNNFTVPIDKISLKQKQGIVSTENERIHWFPRGAYVGWSLSTTIGHRIFEAGASFHVE